MVLTFFLSLLVFASAFVSPTNEPVYAFYEFKVSGSSMLNVKTSGGHIDVQVGNDNMVVVELLVKQGNRFLESGEVNLKDYDIEVTSKGNEILAKVERKSKMITIETNKNNLSFHFKITAPKSSSTQLNTSGGHIKIIGLEGSINATTSGGHITLEQLSGMVNVRTSGGHITGNVINGSVKASTSGGHLKFSQVYGDFSGSTSGGNVELQQMTGAIEAGTSGGSINVTALNGREPIDVKTSGGSILVQIPPDGAYDIDARGTSIRNGLSNFSGKSEKGVIKGKTHEGGTPLIAKTSGGTVHIKEL